MPESENTATLYSWQNKHKKKQIIVTVNFLHTSFNVKNIWEALSCEEMIIHNQQMWR